MPGLASPSDRYPTRRASASTILPASARRLKIEATFVL